VRVGARAAGNGAEEARQKLKNKIYL